MVKKSPQDRNKQDHENRQTKLKSCERQLKSSYAYLKRHRIGTAVILLATIIFFMPIIVRIGSYSPGGDAMFNAWEMSRNQHCILRQGCPNYTDANIYFPNKDTMLYSETQLSAGFVTLPLHFINSNPILGYNLLTIISFYLSGRFMYLLTKYLSRGNESVSLLAGLIFEFAPLRIAAITHLQNLSIFCLPLAMLLLLKFIENGRRKYLIWLVPVLMYVFFASWVQMIFMLVILTIFVLGLWISKQIERLQVAFIALAIGFAALTTLPLAVQYIHFSKTNHATFSLAEQEKYSSSLTDYIIPNDGTLLGKMYYAVKPTAQHNGFNPDSFSYHGFVLYLVAITVFVAAYRLRKLSAHNRDHYATLLTLGVIGIVSFFISIGPLLKVRASYVYPGFGDGTPITIAMPYLLVDKFLPQLSFLRSVGRASILVLFVLCYVLAFLPHVINSFNIADTRKRLLYALVWVVAVIELMPLYLVPMSNLRYSYNLGIPAVYSYIAAHKDIDNILILRGNDDYPGAKVPVARAEDVLWSGYHNRNIFNGYSGYIPPRYVADRVGFSMFQPSELSKMKRQRLRYILVDKLLTPKHSRYPNVYDGPARLLPKIYEDKRYTLFKIT